MGEPPKHHTYIITDKLSVETARVLFRVYLWIGSPANLADCSYQDSLLYQNHTAGWMSQGFVLLKKLSSWQREKKNKSNCYTKKHSPQGQHTHVQLTGVKLKNSYWERTK